MKYFFLSDGWTVGRVWEFGGLWDNNAWRRPPDIKRLNLSLVEQSEKLWLYQVEEPVLMVEVERIQDRQAKRPQSIGQVVLKRLMTSEQVIERLNQAEMICSQPSQPNTLPL